MSVASLPSNTVRCLHQNGVVDYEAGVFAHFFEPQFSIAIWQRAASPLITDYLSHVSLGGGVRGVVSADSVRELLNAEIPDSSEYNSGRQALIDDIILQIDMLMCLVGCESVGFRLTPLTDAMCPKFHVDNIQLRQICTYLGPATEWLPSHLLKREFLGKGSLNETETERLYPNDTSIEQLQPFDVALLKGEAWRDNEGKGIVHRSPSVAVGSTRVVMTLDPM